MYDFYEVNNRFLCMLLYFQRNFKNITFNTNHYVATRKAAMCYLILKKTNFSLKLKSDDIKKAELIIKKRNILFKEIETKSFDEEIAKSQFNDIINRILVWDKQQNVLQYPISIYKLTTSGIIGNTKTLTRITKIEL